MMKKFLALTFAVVFSTAAYGQSATLKNHATAVGKGTNVQGFTAVGPATAGLPYVAAGTNADPLFQLLGFGGGGTNASTQVGAQNNMFPTPTRAGDVTFWNGTIWTTLAGNNSGTNCFSETSSGVPSWAACSGGGGTPGGTPGQVQFNSAGSFGGFTVGGDATLNTATGALTLANTAVTPTSYTNANITVDSKGRITAAANGTLNAPGGTAGQIQFNNTGAFGGFTMSGDATLNTGTGALALATVNANVGSFGSATSCTAFTTNGKGLITAASAVTCTPAIASVTGLGTGVATALGVNIGTAGSFVVNGGALGSPSSAGTMPAYTLGGTVSGGGNQINNVIIGNTTPLAGSFTTLAAGNTTFTPLTGIAGIKINGPAATATTFDINSVATQAAFVRMGPPGLLSEFETDGAGNWQINFTGLANTVLIANHSGAVANTAVLDQGHFGVGRTPTATLDSAGSIACAQPTTKTTAYSLVTADCSLIFNGAGSITLTLQAAASFPGRILYVKTIAAQTVVSATSNVVPRTTATAGTAILAAAAGTWATLQSDGTNWVVMAGN